MTVPGPYDSGMAAHLTFREGGDRTVQLLRVFDDGRPDAELGILHVEEASVLARHARVLAGTDRCGTLGEIPRRGGPGSLQLVRRAAAGGSRLWLDVTGPRGGRGCIWTGGEDQMQPLTDLLDRAAAA